MNGLLRTGLSNHALTLTERLYFLSNPQSDILPRYNIPLKWKGLDFKGPFTPVSLEIQALNFKEV
jgi:hypothetical protein